MTEENLEKAVDTVFERIRNVTFYTANTAKEIILQSHRLQLTPAEYLAIVNSYISDFEKQKEGKTNEKI